MIKIIYKLEFIYYFCSLRNTVESKDHPQTGRSCLQKTHLIKNCYLKYTSNLETQQENNLMKKWVRDLNRHINKKDI